jgi:hypothetical protein
MRDISRRRIGSLISVLFWNWLVPKRYQRAEKLSFRRVILPGLDLCWQEIPIEELSL